LMACIILMLTARQRSLATAPTQSFTAAAKPKYGRAPRVSLTDQHSTPFSSSSLLGKVWVTSFLFTHCGGPCPVLTVHMSNIQEKFQKNDDLKLVSISVDPEMDTPKVLKEYGNRYGAVSGKWFFLTGKKEEIYSIVQQGFLLPLQEGSRATPADAVTHSSKFVLVDRKGMIVDYYDTTSGQEEIDRLYNDIQFQLKK